MNREPVNWWLLALLAAGVLVLVPIPTWIADAFYSRDMFPWVQAWMTSLSNIVPFAVLDVFIAFILWLFVRRLIRLLRLAGEHGVLTAGVEGSLRLIRAVSVLTIMFVWTWGFNYRRYPLDVLLHQKPQQLSAEDLQAAILDANALAIRVRPGATSRSIENYGEVGTRLEAPFQKALKKLSLPRLETPGRPKYSLLLGPFFTWAGVSGMIDPYMLESIVNPDLLPFERPFVVAHEWAHLAGQADEADASAVGWFACMQGGPELAYSASLYIIEEAGAGLPPVKWRDVSNRLDPGVREDLAAIATRLQRERPIVRRTAFRVYDEYLKANRVEDGLSSYSRALAMILAPPLRDAVGAYQMNGDK